MAIFGGGKGSAPQKGRQAKKARGGGAFGGKGAGSGKSSGQKAQQAVTAGALSVEKRVNNLTKAVFLLTLVAAICIVLAVSMALKTNAEKARLEGDLRTVVITSTEIPAGTVITADMLTTTTMPGAFVSQSPTAELEYFVGKTASVKIGANSQINTSEVAGALNSSSLSGKTTDGKVAVSLSISGTAGLSNNLKIGDSVNIYRILGTSMSLVAENMTIIAMDTRLVNDGTAEYSSLSFEADEAMAKRLLLAQESGKLTCTLNSLSKGEKAAVTGDYVVNAPVEQGDQAEEGQEAEGDEGTGQE